MADESTDRETSMREIIVEQFGAELTYKEGELTQIEDRIRLAKLMLQRLRMGVLAQHYGSAGFYPSELDYSQENIGTQGSWGAFEEALLNESETKEEEQPMDDLDKNVSKESTPVDSCTPEGNQEDIKKVTIKDEPMESEPAVNGAAVDTQGNSVSTPERTQPVCVCTDSSKSHDQPVRISTDSSKSHDQPVSKEQTALSNSQTVLSSDQDSRFYRKKRIIVGNTSQYLDPSSQCGGSTHKWMAYVRGSQAEPDISHFVKAVRFFLHPSYHPHDIILINKPPFHLTKLGWGEFPVRVQLEFVDSYNKPVDIIHNLVLDRTHTGHQTLGAETIVDLDLSVTTEIGAVPSVKPSKNDSHGNGPNGINVPLVNGLDTSDLDVSETREISTSATMCATQENEITLDNDEIKLTEESDTEVGVAMETESLAARCCEYIPKSQRSLKHDAPFIIRHISLPLEDSTDSVRLDHDYCSTVVTVHTSPVHTPSFSRESSVPNSEASRLKSEASSPQVLTTNLDKCLHVAVRNIPLHGRASPNDGFLLPATSLAQFQSWPVGRRRASEWMRAVAVRHHVEKQLHIPSVLTTKQVVQWCRRNGYTPLDAITNTPDSGFCKYCGCQLRPQQEGGGASDDSPSVVSSLHKNCSKHLKQTDHTSLSTPYSRFSEILAAQEEVTKQERARELNQEVDIETIPKPQTTPPATGEEDSMPRFRIPQTPELKWIQRTAAGIGISVYPAVIDRMYAHVVEHMIYMSCARFLRSILIQATQEAGHQVEGDLCQERVLVPRHIHQAMCNLESCDFVTGKCLGVEVSGGCGSESESSSSDSDSD